MRNRSIRFEVCFNKKEHEYLKEISELKAIENELRDLFSLKKSEILW